MLKSARKQGKKEKDPEGRMPLADHLRELRNRLMKSVLAILVVTIVAMFYYKQIADFLMQPVKDAVGCSKGFGEAAKEGETCAEITINGLIAPFTIMLKVALTAGVVAASPIWLYQLWGFLAPGLHQHEKKYARSFVGVGVPLFLAGACLAYLILPSAAKALLGFSPEGAGNLIPLDDFLDIVTRLVIVFGLAFELPMSCRIAAAHSRSRSAGSAGWRPAAPSASHISSDRSATCWVWANSGWYCAARLSTLRRRTSSNSGGSSAFEQRLEEHALAQAGLGRPERVEAADLHHRVDHDRRGEDDVGAAGLDAVDVPRSATGRSARRSIRSCSASRVTVTPWTVKSGMSAARWAALARLRTAPPTPTSVRPCAAGSATQPADSSFFSTCARSALTCLGEVFLPSRKRSVMRTAPIRHERARSPAGPRRGELHRAAADVERQPVGQRRRVHGGEVAVAGLLLALQHVDLEPGAARASSRKSAWLDASRIAEVATGRTSVIPVARQKCA